MNESVFRSNRKQCIFALISTCIVAVCVCVGVTMNLVTLYDVNFDNMGIRTFCMFTVDSNILAGLSMLMCIPYIIDGLRSGYYHLPDWVVVLTHVAVTAVALTFLVSLCILSPVKGFRLIFSGSRFFLHGVCPLLSILAFCCFLNSHMVRPKEALLAVIPVLIYAIVYLVMVVFIGKARGGWDDFYGFATRIPLWISLVTILPLTYGIAMLLRWGHNSYCSYQRKKDTALFYAAYKDRNLQEAVEELARTNSQKQTRKRIVIPRQLFRYMILDTGSDMDLGEVCRHYLETYLESEKEGLA